jgi:hypothetical protein
MGEGEGMSIKADGIPGIFSSFINRGVCGVWGLVGRSEPADAVRVLLWEWGWTWTRGRRRGLRCCVHDRWGWSFTVQLRLCLVLFFSIRFAWCLGASQKARRHTLKRYGMVKVLMPLNFVLILFRLVRFFLVRF